MLFARPGFTRKDARDLACELLPKDALPRPVRELSGGQRRRVELARAFAAPGELVLLDEPFKGLDDKTREKVVRFVKETRQHRTMILVTHDPRDAKDLNAAQILNMESV